MILVGHSMGGAIAVSVAKQLPPSRLEGTVLMDVVEGTAIQALPNMQVVLKKRPKGFDSLSDAIQWSIGSRMILNVNSARISIPAMLSEKDGKWVWRTRLEETEKYWMEWFKGLSASFVRLPGPKALILAGTDRLDKELTIAQMQGKYMLVLLPKCGHTIHEDDPVKTAQAIIKFLKHHRIV